MIPDRERHSCGCCARRMLWCWRRRLLCPGVSEPLQANADEPPAPLATQPQGAQGVIEKAQGGIDWPKLGAKAKSLGWEDMLRITLSACRTLFSTPIPEAFFLPQLPPWVKLFPAAPAPLWQSCLFPLPLLKRPSDKLRYLLRVLLWPTLAERRLLRLPSSLGFLYYPLRPLRLGCKWGHRLICTCLQRLRVAKT